GLNMLINTGPILLFTFGVFAKPIIAETGWARETVSAAVLPGQFLLAILGPFVGLAVDRFGPKAVARIAGPVFGLGLVMLGLLAHSALSFTILFALTFVLGAGMVPTVYVKSVAEWVERRRGLALGFALMLSGFGVAVLPPLAAALIGALGWRMAYVWLGVIVWVINVPSVAWLMHKRPARSEGALTSTATATVAPGNVLAALPEITGVRLRTAVGMRAFWLLGISFFLISVVVGAGTWVLPVILSDYGLKAQQGAFVMTIVGVAMMAGRLGFGALLDRFYPPRITAVVFIGALLGFGALALGISAITVPIAAILIGFTLGSEVDALAYLTSRAFGLRHLGVVYGCLLFAFSFGLGVGPALFGFIFKHTGSYQVAFEVAAAAAAIAAIGVVSLRRADLKFGVALAH
ncbi:MAG: MFS transporter, partial [Janthinobacterium lividum]